jgi:hypothetical protein
VTQRSTAYTRIWKESYDSRIGLNHKVQDVLSCKAPTRVSNIQSFLGLTGYYRRFIEGFSKISKPMIELLEKDK